MGKENKLSLEIFIPFYNEENILKSNSLKIDEAISKLDYNYRIVLVDDSSSDGSQNVAKELLRRNNFSYIRYENGPSRRENLAEAIKTSKRDVIVFMDIDLATDLKHLKELVENITIKHYDISIGSRFMGKKAKRGFSRKLLSFVYNNLLYTIHNSKVKDHQCGFKAFKKEVIQHLISDAAYDKKFIRGWVWDAEILIRAQKKGYMIKEFPVEWNSGDKSSFDFFRESKMLWYILKLKTKI